MRKTLALLVLALLVLASPAHAQMTKKKAQAMTQKVSDFDPSIVYTKCDPVVKPDAEHRTWVFPGISPMIPAELLKKAGLNGLNDLYFVRAVWGAPNG
jgi:hypothetical protein